MAAPNKQPRNLTQFHKGIATSVVMDKDAIEKTANYTLTVADGGKTFFVRNGNTVIFTLPALAANAANGVGYTIVNLNTDGQGQVSLSPQALDGISYNASFVDNKDLINTTATAKHGDWVHVHAGDSVVTWQVLAVRGVWDKQA